MSQPLQRVEYTCLLPPSALTALESVRAGAWSDVSVAVSVVASTASTIRADRVRIRGTVDVIITALPVDVIRMLEAFRLHVHIEGDDQPEDPRFRAPKYRDPGEVLGAFRGSIPQVLLGARRYVAPEWAADQVMTTLVEDLLVLRHPSGRQAFIAADDALPGTLIIARDLSEIPSSDAEIAYLRVI